MKIIKPIMALFTGLLVLSSTAMAGQGFGHFTKNSATLPLKDYVALWEGSTNTLKVIYTPSKLTASEKTQIKDGKTVFFILSDKTSPNKQQWQWYPYLVTEIKFKSSQIRSNNVKSFYIMASGVEARNHTDNINTHPDDNIKLNHVDYSNGRLDLNFKGSDSLLDSKYSWDISI